MAHHFIAVPTEDADMPRLFEVTSLAFKHNKPSWDAELVAGDL
jgi:hypothetical protein